MITAQVRLENAEKEAKALEERNAQLARTDPASGADR